MNPSPPKKVQPGPPASHFPEKRQVINYLHKWLSVIMDAAVLLAVTIAGYTAVLYACKIGWHLYLSTPIGGQFANYFPHAARNTSDLLQRDLLDLSVWITVRSFVICIAVGAICRLTHVARYVYEPHGAFGKLAVCGLPLAALIAMYVQPLYGFPEWRTAFVVVLLPTLSVFNGCFTYAEKLLPELGDVKNLVAR